MTEIRALCKKTEIGPTAESPLLAFEAWKAAIRETSASGLIEHVLNLVRSDLINDIDLAGFIFTSLEFVTRPPTSLISIVRLRSHCMDAKRYSSTKHSRCPSAAQRIVQRQLAHLYPTCRFAHHRNWRAYLKAVTYSGLRQWQSCRRNRQAPPLIELILLLHCSAKLATS